METNALALVTQRRLCIAEAVARAAFQPETSVLLTVERGDGVSGTTVATNACVNSTLDRVHFHHDNLCLRVSKLHIKRISSTSLRLLLVSGVAAERDFPVAYRIDFAEALEAEAWLRLLHRMQRVAALREELVLLQMDSSSLASSMKAAVGSSAASVASQRAGAFAATDPVSPPNVLRGRTETAAYLYWDGVVQQWRRTLPYSDTETIVERADLEYGPPQARYPVTADDVGCIIAAVLDTGATVRTASVITIHEELRIDVEAVLQRGTWRLPRSWIQRPPGKPNRRMRTTLTLSQRGIIGLYPKCRPWSESLHIDMRAEDTLQLEIHERPMRAEDTLQLEIHERPMRAASAPMRAPAGVHLCVRTPNAYQRDSVLLVFRAFRALALMGCTRLAPELTSTYSSAACLPIGCFGIGHGRHRTVQPKRTRSVQVQTSMLGPLAVATARDHQAADTFAADHSSEAVVILAPNGDLSVVDHGGQVSISRAACTNVAVEQSLVETSVIAPQLEAPDQSLTVLHFATNVDVIRDTGNPPPDTISERISRFEQRPVGLSISSGKTQQPAAVAAATRSEARSPVRRPGPRFPSVSRAPQPPLPSPALDLATPAGANGGNGPRTRVWRRLHWNCVPLHQVPGSIWSDLRPLRWIPDMDEMAKLFSQEVASGFGAAAGRSTAPADAPESFAVLDAKHVRNLDILLGRFRNVSSEAVADAFVHGDLDALDPDFFEILAPMLPSAPEQARLLEAFQTRKDIALERLLYPERFMLTMLQRVPRIAAKAAAWSTMRRFTETFQELDAAVTSVTRACLEIRQSRRLRLVLEVLLVIGNVLNAGSARANAAGFTIDSVPQLARSRSVISYAGAVLRKNSEHQAADLELGTELGSVQTASRIELDHISTGFSELEHDLQELTSECELSANEPTGRALSRCFRRWLEPARAKLQQLAQRLREMNEAVEDTLLLLPMTEQGFVGGPEVATRRASLRDDLFRYLWQFVELWDQSLADTRALNENTACTWRQRVGADLDEAEKENAHLLWWKTGDGMAPQITTFHAGTTDLATKAPGAIVPPPPPPPPPLIPSPVHGPLQLGS